MMGQILQAGAWWLASGLIGWLAFPLVRRVFGKLPDRTFVAYDIPETFRPVLLNPVLHQLK